MYQMAGEGSKYKAEHGPPFGDIKYRLPKKELGLVASIKGDRQRRLTTGFPLATLLEWSGPLRHL